MNIKVYIPQNNIITEHGYYNTNEIVTLLRKYKSNSAAIQFIADMMEV